MRVDGGPLFVRALSTLTLTCQGGMLRPQGAVKLRLLPHTRTGGGPVVVLFNRFDGGEREREMR